MLSSQVKETGKRCIGTRSMSLVAWGVNRWGECGVSSMKPVLEVPEEVGGVRGEGIADMCTGVSHSLVVSEEGHVYSFGKGSCGELGTGRLDPVFTAARVEHLVGSHRIVSASVGPTHSFYLNEKGHILAAGKYMRSNHSVWSHQQDEDGQPGDGMGDEEDLAQMFLQDEGNRVRGSLFEAHHHVRNEGSRLRVDAYGNFVKEGRGRAHSTPVAAAQEPNWGSMHFVPFIDHRSRSLEIQNSKYMLSEPLKKMSDALSASKLWDDHMSGENATDSVSLPTLLGGGAGLMGSIVSAGSRQIFASRMKGIASCSVSGQSIAIDESNMPVMIEPLRIGLHAFEKTGVPASWAQGSYPSSIVLDAVRDNGGAVKAGIGEHYSCVLTSNGRVVVWWNNVVHSNSKQDDSIIVRKGSRAFYVKGKTMVTVVDSLPPLVDMSASNGSICMSDGTSVWRLNIPSASPIDSLEDPVREMTTKDVGIAKMVAGPRSTAVITGNGKLWLWGTILSPQELVKEKHAAETQGYGHWSFSSADDSSRESSWAGLGGSPTPTEVPGLHGVSDVSLGTKHALAVVV
ncbi:hypothetical protein M9434_000654 [Picochlorum sp. BPE23]|nr:hypothetical protein M9434_000654 [Picochlorum sp. BPE23]